MKKIKLLAATAIITLALSSCASRQSAINDLRSLSNDIELNGSRYSINDWKDAATDYAKINKRLTKHAGDYSSEERAEIAELNTKCINNFTNGAVKQTTSRVGTAVNVIKSVIENVKSNFIK